MALRLFFFDAYSICFEYGACIGQFSYCGDRQRPRRGALAVWLFPVFHALIPADFSKQNSKGFSMLRDALKRHPCRIGLNRPFVAGSPWVSIFCQEKSHRKRSTENREQPNRQSTPTGAVYRQNISFSRYKNPAIFNLGTVWKLLLNSVPDFSSGVLLKNQAHSGLCN